MRTVVCTLLFVVLTAASVVVSQPPAAPKTDPALVEYLREQFAQLKHSTVTVVDTPHVLVVSTLEAGKLRQLSSKIEKAVPIVRESLGFKADENPWSVKLVVCYLPEPRDFNAFVRLVLKQRPERVHYSLDSERPLLVTAAQAPGVNTETDRLNLIVSQVAIAFLRGKQQQAQMPYWLPAAYGRICALRAEGLRSTRYVAYRNQARQLARDNRIKLSQLWDSEEVSPQTELLADTFVEFLAFGPNPDKFAALLTQLRRVNNDNPPMFRQALAAIGWSYENNDLEQAWRQWLLGIKTPQPKEPPKKETPKKK